MGRMLTSHCTTLSMRCGQALLACTLRQHSARHAGIVEVWLQRLVEGMQGTVKAIVKRAARNVYEMDLQSFIFSHPAQMALLGIQFQWTADMQVVTRGINLAWICCKHTVSELLLPEVQVHAGRFGVTGRRYGVLLHLFRMPAPLECLTY